MTEMIDTLKISMGTSPDFLEQILTKDVSTLEALYDLIDNSIDAARNQILLNPMIKKDKYGLPKSYEGFEVTLDISSDSISISDNCLGMDEATLANKAFIIASSSSHEYGIGQYGIGLKRSLLKMGDNYEFIIDNGKKSYAATFNNHNIGGTKGELEAVIHKSSGKPNTAFTVYQLKKEVIKDIQNERWIKNAIKGLEDRYSIYFSKGFNIVLTYKQQNYPLNSKLPRLRTDGAFLPKNNTMDFDGVKVIIESGIHENYYFPNEPKHSLSENRKLTKDFGIYFICNDRVIVKSSTDEKHGWQTKWHSEYNGFVCLVRFIAKNPSDLPWNTSKSAMREDASLFLDVIDHIQPIADTYRSDIKARYGKKKDKKIINPNQKLDSDKSTQEESEVDLTEKETSKNQENLFDDTKSDDSNLNRSEETDFDHNDPQNFEDTENLDDDKDLSDSESTEERKNVNPKKERLKKPKQAKSIESNQYMVRMINRLDIPKFNSLYQSLLDIDPDRHPLLTVVGIWAFLDSLARVDDSYNGSDFSSYFNGKLQKYHVSDREKLKVIKKLFEWCLHEGNFDKHDNDYATLNGLEAAEKFNRLQPVIAHIIENYILPKLQSNLK